MPSRSPCSNHLVQLDHALGDEEQEDACRRPVRRRLGRVPRGNSGVDERDRQLSGEHNRHTVPLPPHGAGHTGDAGADVGAARGEQPQQLETAGHFVLE